MHALTLRRNDKRSGLQRRATTKGTLLQKVKPYFYALSLNDDNHKYTHYCIRGQEGYCSRRIIKFRIKIFVSLIKKFFQP